MTVNVEPTESYPSRFLERDAAVDYEHREYGVNSYSAAVWALQAPLVKKLLREIQQKDPTGRHLDFACGTGRITRLTEDIFPEVDALDISPAMIELARVTCSRARFYVGNVLENPDLCRGPYASASTFRLILNLDPQLRVPILTELNRRLKPGGRLLINLHGNRQSLRQPAILWKRWRLGKGTAKEGVMLNDMSLREVEQCLAASNFVVEEIYGTGILPPTIYRLGLRSLWSGIDSWLSGIGLLKPFLVDLIFVCRKKD
jgi:SAM-dependent methyltransferase